MEAAPLIRNSRCGSLTATETADKQKAKAVEAKERSRVLEGALQIRKQPDVMFREFAGKYLREYADKNKRSVGRDREIVRILERGFGSMLLHEITAFRIEQYKRERLEGKWRGHNHTAAKPIRPGTVNRELDTLRGLFSKAVEWKQLREHPMVGVKRLKVDNRRLRILTEAEQLALLKACPGQTAAIVRLALITGARVGELLALKWEHVSDTEMLFLETKNGKHRCLPLSQGIRDVLARVPRGVTE